MLEGMASNASETERRADKASQDINQFLRCQYLAGCLGEIYEGRIAHVSKMGAFVLLDEPVAEGLIPFRAIRDQLGRLSVLPYALVSDATGKRLSMGDEVTVQLSRVDEKLGHIEFELVGQKTKVSSPSSPHLLVRSTVDQAGKRHKGPQSKRPSKQGGTEVSQDGLEKTDGEKAAPRKSRAKQSQSAQRPAKRTRAKQGKKSPHNSRVAGLGVIKKTDAERRRSKQSADGSVKAAKRPPPKRSSPKGKGEQLTADRSNTRKPFRRPISKDKTK